MQANTFWLSLWRAIDTMNTINYPQLTCILSAVHNLLRGSVVSVLKLSLLQPRNLRTYVVCTLFLASGDSGSGEGEDS